MLIKNVAKGKGAFQIKVTILFIQNLQQVPIKPPNPANNINLNVSTILIFTSRGK